MAGEHDPTLLDEKISSGKESYSPYSDVAVKSDCELVDVHTTLNGFASCDEDTRSNDDESALSVTVQVFVPFLIAGFGTVGAGLVLDDVQHWEVFRKVSQVFILVPALLGLKGNLEMTLAARLSTLANLGHFSNGRDQWSVAVGNIALVQVRQ